MCSFFKFCRKKTIKNLTHHSFTNSKLFLLIFISIQVELRGRVNCGPCCDGDEVVIELHKTKELDKETHVYRGAVIAVLRHKIHRSSYTFVCRVDSFLAHLMKPINSSCPKLSVFHKYISSKYPGQIHELVAFYEKTDTGLKRKKIIKLDPKKRRDTLFVVKYCKWDNKFMYPLGYVLKVIHAGQDFLDSQMVLNLLYQVSKYC